jgi:hypothetical protein
VVEAQRFAEQKAAAEAQRLADQKAVVEAQRFAEQKAAAEAQRLAEQKAAEAAQRLAEQKAAAEAQRLAEQRAAADAQKLADQRAAGEQKFADQGSAADRTKQWQGTVQATVDAPTLADMKAVADAKKLAAQKAAADRKASEQAAGAELAKRQASEKATAEAAAKLETQRAAADEARKLASRKAAETPQQFAELRDYPNANRQSGAAANRPGIEASQGEPQQLALIPPRLEPSREPKVSAGAAYGTWCSGSVKMSLTAGEWRFRMSNGNDVAYPIQQYRVQGESIVITANTGSQTVTTEFSGITGSDLVQLRGRTAGSDWITYNRSFHRC